MLREINPDSSFTFLPAELGVMNNQEKRLNAGASLFVDAIQVIGSKSTFGKMYYKLTFGFVDHGLNQRQNTLLEGSESYVFVIEASGSNSPSVSKTFLFEVVKKDETPAFNLWEQP